MVADQRFDRFAVCLLVALALLVWLPVLEGPYQFDDFVTPVSDPASQSLGEWFRHLGHTLRPVTKLSYAIEADAGLGGNPPARRFVSLLIHAGSCALLFVLARALAPGLAGFWPAAAALLWAVHPVHADGILGISGRPVVLANALLLTALLAYLGDRRWLAAALFLLAGLARETALAGALVFLLVELSGEQLQFRRHMRRLLPIFASLGIAGAWLLTTPRYVQLAEYSFLARPLMSSFVQQVAAAPAGLWLSLRPDLLSIDYGWDLPSTLSSGLFLAGLAMYGAAVSAVVMSRRKSRLLSVGAALWLAAVLPTQSVIPKLDPLTNRPLPLALAALLLLALSLVPLARAAPWRSIAAHGLVAIAALGLSVLSWQRGQLYSSALLLWEDAARKSSTNARPHVNYALELQAAGQLEMAELALRTARRIDPFSSRVERLLSQLEARRND